MTLRALSIAATGGRGLLLRIDAMTRHLACAAGLGVHRARPASAPGGDREPIGAGLGIPPAPASAAGGTLQATQRELDLAIEGEGFLRVLLPDRSVAFTRGGTFRLDPQGSLVSSGGFRLDPPISVPPSISRLLIDPAGRVLGFDPGTPRELALLGQLEVTRFSAPAGLEPMEGTLCRATPAAGERLDGPPGQGAGLIRQGYLETSPLDDFRELDDLVQARRAFDLNARAFQVADEVLQAVNQLRRKA